MSDYIEMAENAESIHDDMAELRRLNAERVAAGHPTNPLAQFDAICRPRPPRPTGPLPVDRNEE